MDDATPRRAPTRRGPSPALFVIVLVAAIAAAAGGLIFLQEGKAKEAAARQADEGEAPNPFEGLPPERPGEE